jgi:nucleotide-binding universal stress UspA family protein
MTDATRPEAGQLSITEYLSPRAHEVGPIVVASGGGKSAHVFTAARLLSAHLNTVPVVLAVYEPLPYYYITAAAPELMVPPELYDAQRERLLSEVKRAVRTAPDGDPAWPIEIVDGQPARALADVSRKWGARLIVMGIGRHKPMDRFMGGELALHVIRLADRPVLAVSLDFVELPRRVVVAIDFSAASVRAAAEALALLADGGTLTLVHVRSPLERLAAKGEDTIETSYTEGVDGLFTQLVARLQGAAAGRSPVTIEKVLLAGDPADELLAYAEANGADLIATGSSGMGFFERLLVGSVATRIVRRSPVSVLAVPRPSAAGVEMIERDLAGETAGTVETTERDRWPELLKRFTGQNMGRPTRLEVDALEIGAQLLETGYTLVGVSYDRKDGRLEFMLRAPGEAAVHLTHSVGEVSSIAVLTGGERGDLALQARHGQGQTVLTFR